MPKRTDINKILLIGAGPIVIGQACEFDYAGTQACKALREEGFEVILLNSNPATIMTDPGMAHKTYIEPINRDTVIKILEAEKPDALLPTLGGQTALNVACEVADTGALDFMGIKMIGADREVIHRAEDRDAFRRIMIESGIDIPKSRHARNMEEALAALGEIGLPCIIRPGFTLGGTGGGIANTKEEFIRIADDGLRESFVSEILIEESLYGWKEFEVELMRDKHDNVVIVCSIENIDPMGIHTGDSITVAPIQTLTDREYQRLRDDSIKIIRAIGVETGGCNIQFAQNPETGRMVAIEMNPRVSRSSALASKATGFPIAKIAAKVAVGYTLDEIPNDITGVTPASFEPTIDYVVVKIPRFTFEKFPGVDESITVQMKSVGEVMSFGRTFKEALQKGLRSLETGRYGLGIDSKDPDFSKLDPNEVELNLKIPNRDRIQSIRYALKIGFTTKKIYDLTGIDPWFLDQIQEIVEIEHSLREKDSLSELDFDELKSIKAAGFSDQQLGHIFGVRQAVVREHRENIGLKPVYKVVDTSAAEFEAKTPYYYSTYEDKDEVRAAKNSSVLILGGGPNRIGQGIEFDYCCCHASFAARELGFESIMMNCNPETVSTDYDTSDRLYFDPVTVEDVLAVYKKEKPLGVIVQFGGQTPLKIAGKLAEAGVKILGTDFRSIARAEDRDQFSHLLKILELEQPPNGTSHTLEEAIRLADSIGYPVLMRPSFVLGGAKMATVSNRDMLEEYWNELLFYAEKTDLEINHKSPVLIDKFLQNAIEIDVDAICDGGDVYIAGIMEHIEEAGIHSGDSACVLPPYSLHSDMIRKIKSATIKLAVELKVRGLMNIQFAVRENHLYILEVNPRASRTVPFVSKVTGLPVAALATKVMLGKSLKELGLDVKPEMNYFGVKGPVFPWRRFPGADVVPGPEMKSTGEVMGIDRSFPLAFIKSHIAAGMNFPMQGTAFISVRDDDKDRLVEIAKSLNSLGFHIVATRGTAELIRSFGIPATVVLKVLEGRPNIVDDISAKKIDLVINTPSSRTPAWDEILIRSTAVKMGVPLIMSLPAAKIYLDAIRIWRERPDLTVIPIQKYHEEIKPGRDRISEVIHNEK